MHISYIRISDAVVNYKMFLVGRRHRKWVDTLIIRELANDAISIFVGLAIGRIREMSGIL